MTRLVYGLNPARELIAAKPRDVRRVLLQREVGHDKTATELITFLKQQHCRLDFISRQELDRLAGHGHHQGILVEAADFIYAEFDALIPQASDSCAILLLLDSIQDPQNLGALLRSAAVFGVRGAVITQDRAAQITPAVTKASAGATERLSIARVVNLARTLDQLKEAGVWIAGAEVQGGTDPLKADLAGPLALIVGGEDSGIRPNVAKRIDYRLTIPMHGKFNSLNASVAGGILLYALASAVRRKR